MWFYGKLPANRVSPKVGCIGIGAHSPFADDIVWYTPVPLHVEPEPTQHKERERTGERKRDGGKGRRGRV